MPYCGLIRHKIVRVKFLSQLLGDRSRRESKEEIKTCFAKMREISETLMLPDYNFDKLIALNLLLRVTDVEKEEKEALEEEILSTVRTDLAPFIKMGRKAPQAYLYLCKTWLFK